MEDRSWVEINLDNFEYNIKNLKKYFKDKIYLQIVKADAYGHGAYQIALKSIELGAKYLGVANYQEGILLRFQNINIPILILSPSLTNEIMPIVHYNLIPSVQSLEFAEKLNDYAKISNKKVKIHINVDTGMGRSGFYYDEALIKIDKIKKLSNIEIEGIFSHYAASENDIEYSLWQFERFKKLISNLDFKPKILHISNSSGIINIDEHFTDMVRVGLLSYGIYTSDNIKHKINLKPVMSFYSRIGHIKIANSGDSIGYNRTYIADKKIKYAILPIGYADGYDFMLSGKGKVLYNDNVCNILGKVSMDMIAIDITKIKNPKVGDTVKLLGSGDNEIKAENLSGLYGGSPYELLCQIGRRAKRYYISNGEITDSAPLSRRDFIPSDYSPQKLNKIIETAISHRIKSKEISAIIFKDFLSRFIREKDKNINYRENFYHIIEFVERKGDFFKVKTKLEYEKILTNQIFFVKCATNENDLKKFFLDPSVEYRWLIKNIFQDNDIFALDSVSVDDIPLHIEMEKNEKIISFKCFNEKLKPLIGQKVKFSISTSTYYPTQSHQLSVFINELTKNIVIKFIHNNLVDNIETVLFFSGENRLTKIENNEKDITVYSRKDMWIFPDSGVVFTF